MLNDKYKLAKLRTAIDFALSNVAELHELTSLKTGNIRYDGDGTTATIQVKAVAARADGKTKEQLDFEKYGEMYGLKPEHFGARFTRNGEEWEVIGLLPNRRKFPILAIRSHDSKRMMFTTDIVPKLCLYTARHEAL